MWRVYFSGGVCLPNSWGVLDCDSQFTILSPLSFDGPQLSSWRSVSACTSLHLLTRAHCAQCFPSIPLWSQVRLVNPCTCWRKDTITRLCASLTCVTWLYHMIVEDVVFLSFWYIKLFELGVEVSFTTDPRSPTTKLICSNPHFGAAALSAPMMLWCCLFATASFTCRNPSSLSVDCLNSKIYSICTASLIATPSGPAPKNIYAESRWIQVVLFLLTFCDWYYHLSTILCLLCQIFLAADSEGWTWTPRKRNQRDFRFEKWGSTFGPFFWTGTKYHFGSCFVPASPLQFL